MHSNYDCNCIFYCDRKNIQNKKLPKEKLYSGDDLETAIVQKNIEMKPKQVSINFTNIHSPNIKQRIKKAKEEVAILNAGPKPMITNELEEELQQWIIGMQRNKFTILRYIIIMKGNEIYCLMYGTTI